MENLINKWKKMMNNEKTQNSEETSGDTNRINNKNLNSSQMSSPSERSNKFSARKTKSRTNSENILVRSNSSKTDRGEYQNESNTDKILILLNKTLNYVQKNNPDNLHSQRVADNLNEIIELYIKNMNSSKLVYRKTEEKEILWQTKCDTTEKIIKDLELKVLTSEKDKTRLKKQIEGLNDLLEDTNEKNVYLAQCKDMVHLLETNNKVLTRTNQQLNDDLNEYKTKNQFLVKRFEEEVDQIKDKMDLYKTTLTKLCTTMYGNNS